MTHRQPAAFGSPVFRIRAATSPFVFRCCPPPRQISGLPAAPPDLRPPRGLPARSPSALRASLGASARSPARPCRPRGSLQSGDLSRCFPSLSQPSTPHAIQNSPSTPEPSCKRYKTRPAHTKHPQISRFSQAGRILSRRLFEAHRAGRVSSHSPAPCSRVPIAWPSWQRCKPPNAHTNRLCRIWDGTPMHG